MPPPKAFKLVSPFKPTGDQPKAIAALIKGLEEGLAYQTLLGVTGAGKTFTVANVIEAVQRPALMMAPNKTLAAQLYSEMKAFFPTNAVEYFVSYYDYYQPEAYVPSSDTFIEKDASINEQIEQMRLSATKAILEREDTIIISTVSAIYGLGDPTTYLKMMLHVSRGEQINPRQILRRLAELHYTRNESVLSRGNYRVQGDVIDVYPAESDKEAIRLLLFDNEIEDIQRFDPLTGKLLGSMARVTIYPKSHYVTPREVILKTIDAAKLELKDRLAVLREQDKLVEAQRLEQRVQFDIEMMLELGYCSGIENYSRYLSGREAGEPPPTLFSYLPSNALLFIDESHVTVPQLGGMYRGDRARKETLVHYGFRLPSALDNRPMNFEEFVDHSPQTVFISATPGAYELEKAPDPVQLLVRPTGLVDPAIEIRPIKTQVDDLLSEVKERAKRNERTLVTTLTKKMAEDLTDYLYEQGVKVRYLHSDIGTVERVDIIRDLRLGVFDVLVGINLLREGLDLPEVSLVAILDADKEGFLRSERSLIQTIGRAARHLHGKAILYADRITGSMERAIGETERRRTIQSNFNKAHGITPTSIKKKIDDVFESGFAPKPPLTEQAKQVAEASARYRALPPKELAKQLASLEKQMLTHAKNLAFEEAAHLRDKIEQLRQAVFLDDEGEG